MKGESSILISGILYGTAGVLIKMAMSGTSSVNLLFFRLSISALVGFLILLVLEKGKSFKLNKQEVLSFIVIGALTILGMGLYIWALKYTSIANAILLIYLFPTITAFFAIHFLHEKITKFTWLALAVSFVGVVALVYPDLSSASSSMFGNFLALLAGFACAAVTILVRHEDRICSVDRTVFWPLAFAAILFLPMALLEGGTITFSRGVLFPLVALGILTAFARYGFTYGLKFVEAHTTAILGMVTEVIFSILFAFLFLGELIGLNTFLGGALILSAGLAAQIEMNRKVRI